MPVRARGRDGILWEFETQELADGFLAAEGLSGSEVTEIPAYRSVLEPEVGFFGGIRENLIPTVEEIKSVGTSVGESPATRLLGPAGGLAEMLVRGTVEAGREQFGKAREHAREGDIGGTATHLLGMTPLIGPPAAEAAHRIASGEEVARGIGNVVGLAVPLPGGRAVKTALGKVKPKRPAKTVISGVEIPQTFGERHMRGPLRFVQNLEGRLESLFPASGRFGALRERQFESLNQAGDNLVRNISVISGSPSTVGRNIRNALAKYRDGLRKQIDEADKALDGIAGYSIRVDMTPLQTYAGTILKRVREAKRGFNVAGLAELENLIGPVMRKVTEAELKGAPKKVTLRGARTAVRLLDELTAKNRDAVPGAVETVRENIKNIADNSIRKTLQESGREDLFDLYKESTRTETYLKQDFNSHIMAKMLSKKESVARVHHVLLDETTSPAQIKEFFDTVGPGISRQVKNRLARDILAEATEGEAVSGAGKLQGRLSGKKLNSKLESLAEDGRLKELFNPETIYTFRELADTAATTGLKVSDISAKIYGWSLLSGMTYGAATLNLPVLAGGAASVAGINILARLMTKPEGWLTARRMIRAVGRNDLGQMAFWGKRISETVSRVDPDEPLEAQPESTETGADVAPGSPIEAR